MYVSQWQGLWNFKWCWKSPITLNTLPLLHRSSVSWRPEVTCHWPVINELARTPWSSSVSEGLHLLRRLSVSDSCFLYFPDLWDSLLRVELYVVLVFLCVCFSPEESITSSCILQAGQSLLLSSTKPLQKKKKKKLNLLLFDPKVSPRHLILDTLERAMLNLNFICTSEELGQLLQPQSHCHRVQCSTKRRIILSNCWLHRCLDKWCRDYNILNGNALIR